MTWFGRRSAKILVKLLSTLSLPNTSPWIFLIFRFSNLWLHSCMILASSASSVVGFSWIPFGINLQSLHFNRKMVWAFRNPNFRFIVFNLLYTLRISVPHTSWISFRERNIIKTSVTGSSLRICRFYLITVSLYSVKGRNVSPTKWLHQALESDESKVNSMYSAKEKWNTRWTECACYNNRDQAIRQTK